MTELEGRASDTPQAPLPLRIACCLAGGLTGAEALRLFSGEADAPALGKALTEARAAHADLCSGAKDAKLALFDAAIEALASAALSGVGELKATSIAGVVRAMTKTTAALNQQADPERRFATIILDLPHE